LTRSTSVGRTQAHYLQPAGLLARWLGEWLCLSSHGRASRPKICLPSDQYSSQSVVGGSRSDSRLLLLVNVYALSLSTKKKYGRCPNLLFVLAPRLPFHFLSLSPTTPAEPRRFIPRSTRRWRPRGSSTSTSTPSKRPRRPSLRPASISKPVRRSCLTARRAAIVAVPHSVASGCTGCRTSPHTWPPGGGVRRGL
jgi:hypothetical protein